MSDKGYRLSGIVTAILALFFFGLTAVRCTQTPTVLPAIIMNGLVGLLLACVSWFCFQLSRQQAG